ncbi:helix-turn-helix transcriptional regulator [Peribacillus acanthi]|uniref:helix-turn-helix transcriptional regulator n=1 Tax=Peribacillus acanthi TaxID=2171554 RepID=UPI000D3E2731|nr:helix-turn-helix transcriptional regulator [Peribacillus acanthi]
MLGNRVKELRARFNLTQGDLAEKIGVTRQTIGFIEKGDYSPSIQLALKIAKEFKCSVEEIFWLEGED